MDLSRFVRAFPVIYSEGLRRAAPMEAALSLLLKEATQRRRELPVLKRTYDTKQIRLRFVGSQGINDTGTLLMERLRNTANEDLDPLRYGVEAIRIAREALEQAERPGRPAPPRRSELKVLQDAAATAEPTLPEAELHQHLLRSVTHQRGLPRLARAFARDLARQQHIARMAAELELALADGFLSYARDLSGGLLMWHQLRATRDKSATVPPKNTPDKSADLVRRELERALGGIKDPASAKRVLQRLAPHPQYHKLQVALLRYKKIVDEGGWREVKPRRLRPGRNSRAVEGLARRLAAEGYLEGPPGRAFDARLAAAVRAYQRTHQLEVTGVPHRFFWRSLNIPAQRRLAAIRITLQRWRESAAGRAPYYAMVNIPDFHVEVWRGGKRLLRQKVIVGRSRETKCDEETRRKVLAFATPQQSAWLRTLVFSPYWNVTRTIKESELDLERGKDPFYYEKHGYEVMEAGKTNEWVREMPGPANSLGFVKFLFPNPHETYLHGTPHRNQFNHFVRAYSHGCMRVEHPRPLARLLLQHDGQWNGNKYGRLYQRWKSMDFTKLRKDWDPERYETLRYRAMSLESRVELKRPIPIHVEYFTVRVDDSGDVHFLSDIYRLDEQRLKPRPARRCIPESRLAKRNVAQMTKRVEELEKQAVFLGPCSIGAAALAQTLDPKGSWEVRRRLRRLQQLQQFTKAHANLAQVVRAAHKELLEALEEKKGRWRQALVRRAIRVNRLLQGLEKMTQTTQNRCARLVGTKKKKD